MRWLVAAFLGCFFMASVVQAEQTFPYKAFVTSDDVYVRSGPGDSYYPTDKLKVGQEVEVYRHDPGGWYAIRPPEGSFSWVHGRYLKLGQDHLATLTEDRIAARVGSRFSDVRDSIQVRLQKGETVEVLEAKRTGPANANASNTWYKIAPPSGEFRWVSARFVDPDYSADGLRRTRSPSGVPTDATSGSGSPPPRQATSEQFQAAIDDMELELSTMVVEEPSVWDFGELQQRAQSYFDQANTALERGRARMMLSKIARFEDIRQRYHSTSAVRDQLARVDRRLSRLSQAAITPANPNGRYDAVGRLSRVSSSKPGAPQYAIKDETGQVVCYVSPAPGVNLRSYVGQQVGINGSRGYIPEQRTSHVMAQHVSVVDGTTLR